MERSKAGPDGFASNKNPDLIKIPSFNSHYNNKHNIVLFYKINKKYNEIQLTPKKIDLNNQKWKIIHSLLQNKERSKVGAKYAKED